jgi:two-component system cell cycle response regulator
MIMQHCRVLLVEDDPITAKVTGRMLGQIGEGRYAITHTAKLEETLALLNTEDFDVVLADLNLPDSKGLNTPEVIMASDPDVPVIVLTSTESDEIGIKAVQLGAQDYLVKGAFSESSLNRSILYSVERHRLKRTIRQLAVIDELTGLYNRRGFNSLKGDLLQRSREEGHRGFLCYFDLDHFKSINDRFGHAAGDEALNEFAGILRRVFRKETILVRIGGDEFLAMGLESRPGLLDEHLQLLGALVSERNRDRSSGYALEPSVGIAHFDRDSSFDMDQVLAEADHLLYDDKRRRRQSNGPMLRFPGKASA